MAWLRDQAMHTYIKSAAQGQAKTNRIIITTMKTDLPWIVVRIDGKVAAISNDYRLFAGIAGTLAKMRTDGTSGIKEISCTRTGFDEVWQLRRTLRWEDMTLFGTPFQKKVWKRLFDLRNLPEPELISYSDFAELCENRPGVRAVAHAVGLNPVSVVIPCHLVIPKESTDKISEIKKKAEVTLFKGDDLCFLSQIDFGNYALGPDLKRELIIRELSAKS